MAMVLERAGGPGLRGLGVKHFPAPPKAAVAAGTASSQRAAARPLTLRPPLAAARSHDRAFSP